MFTAVAVELWKFPAEALLPVASKAAASVVDVKTTPPLAFRKTSVLGVAAVDPAVAPLTVVPFAEINPVRFDKVDVVIEFGPGMPR
jgi:hypothetical protein